LLLPKFLAVVSPRLRNPFLTSRRVAPGRHRTQPGTGGAGVLGGPTQRDQGLVGRIDAHDDKRCGSC
jgi:hypothetical protein